MFSESCDATEQDILAKRASIARAQERELELQVVREPAQASLLERFNRGDITEAEFHALAAINQASREAPTATVTAATTSILNPLEDSTSAIPKSSFDIYRSETDRQRAEAAIADVRSVISILSQQIGDPVCPGPTGPKYEPMPLPGEPDFMGMVDNCGNRRLAERYTTAQVTGLLTLSSY